MMPLLARFSPLLSLLSADPAVRMMQIGLLLTAVVVVYLVFYVLRDIVLRTHSFLYQLVSILLVAFFPILGFLVYLLIRPTRTIHERAVSVMLEEILARFPESAPSESPHPSPQQKHAVKKK